MSLQEREDDPFGEGEKISAVAIEGIEDVEDSDECICMVTFLCKLTTTDEATALGQWIRGFFATRH